MQAPRAGGDPVSGMVVKSEGDTIAGCGTDVAHNHHRRVTLLLMVQDEGALLSCPQLFSLL